MSEEQRTHSISVPIGSDREDDLPAFLRHVLPKIDFGMRTAALAGLVVSAGAVAIGLSGVFDDPTGVAYTTCSRTQGIV